MDKHRSGGWKKDLDYYIRAYFCYNHPHTPMGKWPKLKRHFFQYLIEREEEWRALRESNPVGFMPYMVDHFKRVTGL